MYNVLILYKIKKAQKVYGKPTHNKKEKQRNSWPISSYIYVDYLAQTLAPRTGFHWRESVNHVGRDRQTRRLWFGVCSRFVSLQNPITMPPPPCPFFGQTPLTENVYTPCTVLSV